MTKLPVAAAERTSLLLFLVLQDGGRVVPGCCGIGRAIAVHLARQGATVAGIARPGPDLAALPREADGAAGRLLACPADVTSAGEVEAAFARVDAGLGTPELVVACAGTADVLGPPWLADPQQWWQAVAADVRALVADGKIGSVVIAEVEMSSGRTGLARWRTDPALAGMGSMNNIGVHGYDLLCYLLGAEVTEVTVLLGKEPEYQLETTVLALLRFGNGALAYVNANQSVPGHRPDMVLYGTEGRVVGHRVTRPNLKGRYEIQTRDGESSREADTSGAYRKTVSDFADAVLQGREPSPSGLDGLRSVRLTEAMARSAAERATVRTDP